MEHCALGLQFHRFIRVFFLYSAYMCIDETLGGELATIIVLFCYLLFISARELDL